MQLSQIQGEAIGKAQAEGQLEAGDMVRLLLYDPDEVAEVLRDLVDRGLMEVVDDKYLLTDQGQSLHAERESADRAAVARLSDVWQR
jgi:Mn-dependent DtxR family transcriptional regulator